MADPLPDNNIDISLTMADEKTMGQFMSELTTVKDNMESMVENLGKLAESFEKMANDTGDHASRTTAAEPGDTSSGTSSAAKINLEAQEAAARQATANASQSDPVFHTPSSTDEWLDRAKQRLRSHHPAEAIGVGAAEGFKMWRSGKSETASDADEQLTLDGFGPESLHDEEGPRLKIMDRLRLAKEAVKDEVRDRTNPAPNSSGDKVGGPPGLDSFKMGAILNAASTLSTMHFASKVGAGSTEQDREYTGAAFGYDQQGGDLTVPGTGVGGRLPFVNPASRHMIQEDFEKVKYRAQPGVNKQQAEQIFNSGYERGFTPQTEQATDVFRTAMKDMMQQNSVMASDPRYQDMLGDAIKYGAISLDDFNRKMRSIPEIAAKANVGLDDFMNGLQDLTNQVTETGGNPYQAANWATQFTASTGHTPQDMATISKSPFFSATAYKKTGLLPFEQGLMSGAQATDAATSTIFDIADNMGKFPALKTKSPDGGTGTVSAADRQAAFVAMATGVPSQKVRDVLKNKKRIQATARMGESSSQLLGQLRNAHGDKDAIKASMDKGNINKHDNITTWGEVNERMKDTGFSKKERAEVWKAGQKEDSFMGVDALARDDKQDPVKAMEARIKRMQEIEAKHSGKNRGKGGKTTDIKIDLTDSAKKLLKVVGTNATPTPIKIAKDIANSGGGLPNDVFGIAKSVLPSNPVKGIIDTIGVDLPHPHVPHIPNPFGGGDD